MDSARSLGSRSFTGIVNSGWTCVDIVDGDWEYDIGRNCVGIVNEFWWAAFTVGVDERRSAIAVEAGDEFCRFGGEDEYDDYQGHRGGSRVQGGPPPC